MPLTNYGDQKLIQSLFSATAFAAPGTLYMAASTTTPNKDGSNFTEPSGNGYARKAVTNDGTQFHAAAAQPGSGFQENNNATFAFAVATGGAASWGTVTYIGFYDSAAGGNLVWYGALTVAQTIGGGDTLQFVADQIQITLN